MNVQQLIDLLNEVKNKSMPVCVGDWIHNQSRPLQLSKVYLVDDWDYFSRKEVYNGKTIKQVERNSFISLQDEGAPLGRYEQIR